MVATRESPIILYDIEGTSSTSWSPHVYRTRLALNYKALPYRIECISFPDIGPRMKELGVTPSSNTYPYYTLPVIADPSRDPGGMPVYVSDSFKIAIYLDDTYPAPQYPSIFAPGTRCIQHLFITQCYPAIAASIVPLFMHKMLSLVDQRSADYLRCTRGDRVKPLSEEVNIQHWEDSRKRFEALGKSVELNEAGPFVMGHTMSFIDFAIAGMFYWISRLDGEDSARLKEMLEWQGGKWDVLWRRIREIEQNSSHVA